MTGGNTFYDILGVDEDAEEETIERAYRKRVKEYHPDVSDHPNARVLFRRIKRARDVLCDRKERARYDRLGHKNYVADRQSGGTADETAGGSGTGSRRQRTGGGSADRGSRASSRSRSSDGTSRTSHRSGTGRSAGGTADRSAGRSSDGGASTAGAGTSGTTGSAGAGRSRGSSRDAAGDGRTASAEAGPDGWSSSAASRVSHSPRGGDWHHDERARTDGAPGADAPSGRFAASDAITLVVLALLATGVLGLSLAASGVGAFGGSGGVFLVGGWLAVVAVGGWMLLDA